MQETTDWTYLANTSDEEIYNGIMYVSDEDYEFLLDLIADTDFSNTLEIDMDNLNPDYYLD